MKVEFNKQTTTIEKDQLEIGVVYLDNEGDVCFLVNEYQMFWPVDDEGRPALLFLADIRHNVSPFTVFPGKVTLSNV